jgi:hypothetical protein
MTIRPDSLFDNFGVSLDKNFAKFKVVRYNNIFFYHLFKFNPLNFLGFSPCTNNGDGGILLSKIILVKSTFGLSNQILRRRHINIFLNNNKTNACTKQKTN